MKTYAKILLAEDEEVAAHYLRQSLIRMGYEVTGVVNAGEEVIEQVEKCTPDLILMDINLSGKIDGICAVEKLHARFDIPVIYITANTDNNVFERAIISGPHAYLIKPYELRQLQSTIQIALAKHAIEKQLKESEIRYRTLFDVSDNAMMVVDEHAMITMVNNQFEAMTGCSRESVENKLNWTVFFDRDEQQKVLEQLHGTLDAVTGQRHFESVLLNKNGASKAVYTNVKQLPGTGTHIISMNDISQLKQAEREIRVLNAELNIKNQALNQEIILRGKVEQQLRYKATHDHLTGLPNRVLLFDRMKQAFAFESRHNKLLALMILDLDNFKTINDTLGHLSGDILLKRVALGLQKCMRQYDTVGRLGGDEFVIIINDADSMQNIITFAEKVQAVFQEPFDILGQQVYVTTSIGVAVYPLHGTTIETLMRKADIAMYNAKNEGRNTFRFFSVSMDVRSSDKYQYSLRTKRRITTMKGSTLDSFLTQSSEIRKKDQVLH